MQVRGSIHYSALFACLFFSFKYFVLHFSYFFFVIFRIWKFFHLLDFSLLSMKWIKAICFLLKAG